MQSARKKIGEFLRGKRKEKGYSMQRLSQLSGISTSEISRIETGVRPTSTIQTLEKLTTALGVTLDELLREAGYVSDSDPAMRLVEEEISKFPNLRISKETKLKLAEVIREHLRTDISVLSEKAG